MWMDVDIAIIVPANVLPLIDDTDFKSIETGVVYNSAGIAITWNFVTTAGVVSGVAVTPTTGGVYDWSEPVADKGMYAIEIPASGGGSANNDTEGFGWITGVADGVLPWRGPVIGFRDSDLNDLLIDSAYSATRGLAGTALPAAAADAAGGLPISDAGALDLDTQIGTDIDAILTDTAEIGAAGASLTDLGGMSTGMKAEVEAEATDALEADGLDHLVAAAVTGTDIVDNSIIAKLVDDAATADWDGYDPETASLEALNVDADAILVDTAEIGTAGAGLTDLGGMATGMKAEVNVEVLDVLNTDTFAEPSSAPAATNTLVGKIGWLFALARNKITQTSATQTLRNDADGGDIATASVSDDATTYTRAEWS